jgi:hypothetical protein
MKEPAYPAARSVARAVEAHFRHHLALAQEQGQTDVAPVPDAPAVERMVDAAFWASLRREEGRAPTISLAYLPPEQAGQPLRLERRLAVDPDALTRLAPAVERAGIHLGVWRDGDELRVWGATRAIPPLCFVLEVIEPGLLVIKHRRAKAAGKFVNVLVLEGDQVKVVDPEGTVSTDCPGFVNSLLGFDAPSDDGVSVLLQLALSMRAHRHGGSLLVVPHGTDRWRDSILWPVPYVVAPPFTKLSELMRASAAERGEGAWQDTFRSAIDAVGGLTAVDGATVLSDRWDVLAFGAKIGRRHASAPVEDLLVKEPIVGRAPVVLHSSVLGGTRHLSAAQFVQEQQDALALVASQDGRFTVFAWSDGKDMVQAYRVETLLL